MNKLEVGMYVRYYDRNITEIGKIIGIVEDTNTLYEVQDKDGYVFEDNNFIKASHNIIDLIEVGDYVNESKVRNVSKETGTIFCELGHITEENYDKIYSIVTKEQFSSMEYKVGD